MSYFNNKIFKNFIYDLVQNNLSYGVLKQKYDFENFHSKNRRSIFYYNSACWFMKMKRQNQKLSKVDFNTLLFYCLKQTMKKQLSEKQEDVCNTAIFIVCKNLK